jgi:hypothetical protein
MGGKEGAKEARLVNAASRRSLCFLKAHLHLNVRTRRQRGRGRGVSVGHANLEGRGDRGRGRCRASVVTQKIASGCGLVSYLRG